MTASIRNQIRCLNEKQYVQQRRRKCLTIIEFIVPFITIAVDCSFKIALNLGDLYLWVVPVLNFISCYLPVKRILDEIVIEKENKFYDTMKFNGLSSFAFALSYIKFLAKRILMFALLNLIGDLIISDISILLTPILFTSRILFGINLVCFCLVISLLFKEYKFVSYIGTSMFTIQLLFYVGFMFNYKEDNAITLLYPYIWLPIFPHAYIYLIYSYNNSFAVQSYIIGFGSQIVQIFFYLCFFIFFDDKIRSIYKFRRCKKKKNEQKKQKNDKLTVNYNLTDDTESSYILIAQDGLNSEMREAQGLPSEKFAFDIQDLSFQYKKDDVLKDLSLKIEKNEIFFLLGKNGSGKTTLLQILCGFIKPKSGQIRCKFKRLIYHIVLGKDISVRPQEIKDKIGFCQQHDIILENMTVEEHLNLIAMLDSQDQDQSNAKVERILTILKLNDQAKILASELSLGQKRKLQLGFILLGDNKNILIIDEVTSGLDIESRREIGQILQSLKSTKTIIISTQNLEEADFIADRVCILNDGHIAYQGTAHNFKKDFNIRRNIIIQLGKCSTETIQQINDYIEQSNNQYQTKIQQINYMEGKEQYSIKIDDETQDSQAICIVKWLETQEDIKKVDIEHNNISDSFLLFKKDFVDIEDLNEISHKFTNLQIKGKSRFQITIFIIQVIIVLSSRFKRLYRNYQLIFLALLPVLLCYFQLIQLQKMKNTDNDGYPFLYFVYFGYTFSLSIGFQLFPLFQERENNINSILHLNGMKIFSQYLGNLIFDLMLFYLVTIPFTVVLSSSFVYVDNRKFQLLIILMVLGQASMNYLLTKTFSNSNSGLKIINMVYQLLFMILYGAQFMVFTVLSLQWKFSGLSYTDLLRLSYSMMDYILILIPLYQSCYYAQVELFNQFFDYKENELERILEVQFKFSLLALLFCFLLFSILYFIIDYLQLHKFQRKDGAIPIQQHQKISNHNEQIEKSNDSILNVKNLFKKYNSTGLVLNGINIILEKGQIFGLIGPNGSGKSTFLDIISLQKQYSDGSVSLFGINTTQLKQANYRNKIGIVSQYNILWNEITVEEHLYFYGKIKGLSLQVIKQETEFLIKNCVLESSRHLRAEYLSGGTKRKLCIALALLGHPEYIVLDEPFTGVDPISKESIYKILKLYKEESLIILSSHRLDEVKELCDNIAILYKGQISAHGNPQQFIEKEGTYYRILLEINGQDNIEILKEKMSADLPQFEIEIIGSNSDNKDCKAVIYKQKSPFVLSEAMLILSDYQVQHDLIKSYDISKTYAEHVFNYLSAFNDVQQQQSNIQLQQDQII